MPKLNQILTGEIASLLVVDQHLIDRQTTQFPVGHDHRYAHIKDSTQRVGPVA